VPVFKPAGEDRPGSHLAFNLAEIFGESPQPGDKKKGGAGESNKGIFEIFYKLFAIS
jgi:hypothetical protein